MMQEYTNYIEAEKSKRPKQRNMFALPPPIPEMQISE